MASTPAAGNATNGAVSDFTAPALGSATMGALVTPMSLSLGSSSARILPASSSLAVNVASVRTHEPVTLNLKTSNFTKWRMLICVLLGKYDLLDHVTAVAARTPDWTREDYIVRSWLYGSISDEILNIIMAEDQTSSSTTR
jgi:hypothetical protein